MNCTYERELLALLANGDATADEQLAAEAHLRECAECRMIMTQYRANAAELAAAVRSGSPAPLLSRRHPGYSWRYAAAAAAIVLGLVGAMQVPAVASQVGKVMPFLQVLELDRTQVAGFISSFGRDRSVRVYNPTQYATLADAEQAWGNRIPRPALLPAGVELYRIELMPWDSGNKDIYLRYNNPQSGANLTVHISTQPQQRKVPAGATSEKSVNGQKAILIRGTFSQYPGGPLQWDPDSDMHLFFPLGGFYGEVSTVGQNPIVSADDLVRVAESLR